jgi:hypothetical protein
MRKQKANQIQARQMSQQQSEKVEEISHSSFFIFLIRSYFQKPLGGRSKRSSVAPAHGVDKNVISRLRVMKMIKHLLKGGL